MSHATVSTRLTPRVELLALLVAFLVVSLVAFVSQHPLTYQEGRGWDGVEYYRVAEAFASGQTPAAAPPFVFRPGVPFLVAHLAPAHLLLGFKLLNLAASGVITMLLLVWLRGFIASAKLRLLLCLLFLTQWHAPTRYLFYYPVMVDPLAQVFLLGGLIALRRWRERPSWGLVIWLGFIVGAGVFVREVVLLIGMAFLFAAWRPSHLGEWRSARVTPAQFLPFFLGVAGIYLTHRLGVATQPFSFATTAKTFLYSKSLAKLTVATFTAFGPVLVLPLFTIRETSAFLVRNIYLLVYLLCCAALAWIGGADTERILYWSFPVAYLVIGKAIEELLSLLRRSAALVSVLVLTQILAQRIPFPLPDYPGTMRHRIPLLAPVGWDFPYLDVYAEHGSPTVQTIAFCQYGLLAVALLYWLGQVRRATATPSA